MEDQLQPEINYSFLYNPVTLYMDCVKFLKLNFDIGIFFINITGVESASFMAGADALSTTR